MAENREAVVGTMARWVTALKGDARSKIRVDVRFMIAVNCSERVEEGKEGEREVFQLTHQVANAINAPPETSFHGALM